MNVPEFFVPKAEPDEQESVYAALAEFAQRRVPPATDRIYSITFGHDGVEWTATVGERLKGHTIANPRARAKMCRIESCRTACGRPLSAQSHRPRLQYLGISFRRMRVTCYGTHSEIR
jgi:hypothetical protein